MSESYLADNLRSLREAKKYSQKYISEQLHIARQTYTVYESGNRVPDISLICKLADIYDVSLDQLVLTDLSAHSDIIADGTEPRPLRGRPQQESDSLKWRQRQVHHGFLKLSGGDAVGDTGVYPV